MTVFSINRADRPALLQQQATLQQQFAELKALGLQLDLTRGKPSAEQLQLSDALDGILAGNYKSTDGTDTTNYGGLDGLPASKAFFADIMGVNANEMLIGGNSSLTLMYYTIAFAHTFGLGDAATAWKNQTA